MTDKEGSLKEISDKLEAINGTLKEAFLKPKKNEDKKFQKVLFFFRCQYEQADKEI